MTLFKLASINVCMNDGHMLVREVKKRFGTLKDVVKGFLKANDQIQPANNEQDVCSLKTANIMFSSNTKSGVNAVYDYPSFFEIATVFQSLLYDQSIFEASNKPKMLHALSMLEILRQNLIVMVFAAAKDHQLDASKRYIRLMGLVTLPYVDEVT